MLGSVLSDFESLLQVGLQSQGRVYSRDDLENLSDFERTTLINQVIEHIHLSAKVTNIDGLQGTFYSKFGKIIIDAINRDISLPHGIKAIARFIKHDFRITRILSRLKRKTTDVDLTDPVKFAEAFRLGGVSPIYPVINQIKALRRDQPIEAAAYAQAVLTDAMSVDQRKLLTFSLYDGGSVKDSASLANELGGLALSSAEAMRVRRILSEHRVLSTDLTVIRDEILRELSGRILPTDTIATSCEDFNIAYVAASTLPFNTAGYAIRTHHLVQAMSVAAAKENISVIPVGRPAYPWDRFDLDTSALVDASHSDVDEIRYTYLKSEVGMQDDILAYAQASAQEMVAFCQSNNIHAICAASNHVNAFQAFLAARYLEIPFTYEVRGLWEESRTARTPGWETTDRFAVERKIETFLIEQADHVFFITRQVRDVFLSPESKRLARTSLAPNCAVIPDGARVSAMAETAQTGPMDLLYLGSLLEYEGLQLLLEALSKIDNLDRFHLTIVGGGRYEVTLKNLALSLGLTESVTFIGRVTPDKVEAYYEASDVVVVPRLPNRVTQLVSPLKPLEAMMFCRVCLASNVAPIADLIKDGRTGYLFEAGDVLALQAKLEEMYTQRSRFNDIASDAMGMVRKNRDWQKLGAEMIGILARLGRNY